MALGMPAPIKTQETPASLRAAVRKLKDRQLIDFARIVPDPAQMGDNYHGLCW